MNPAEYDSLLSSLMKSEDWAKIPYENYLLYISFGSVNPIIAKRPHKLVQNSSFIFRKILSIMGDKAATIKRYIPSLVGSDYHISLYEEIKAWEKPENQEWLISQVENMKYEYQNNILFKSSITIDAISKLSKLNYRVCEREWFNLIDEILDELQWAYVPLPEDTPLDFFVVRDDLAGKLDELEEEFSKEGWVIKSLRKGKDRYHWPIF